MLANASLAYYTDDVTAHNVFTSGGISVSLDETNGNGDPWQDVTNVMPGDTVPKIVTVTNEEQPAWVRVWVEIECRRATPEGGMKTEPMSVQDFLGGRGNIVIDFNTTDWTYNTEDGHFYYNTRLAEGAESEPLFTHVVFDAEDMGNDWQNGKLTISVTAEAVQAANNPDAAGFACSAKHEYEGALEGAGAGDGEGSHEKREDESDGDGDTKDPDPDAGSTPLPGANKPDGEDVPPPGESNGGEDPGADVEVPGNQGMEEEIVSPGGDALPTG